MSDNNQNSNSGQKPLTRLSLSNSAIARAQTNASRTVTVEVKRKRVSLLDKKQALTNSTQAQETPQNVDVKQVLAGSHSLTSSELDARLRALKNAASQKEIKEETENSEESASIGPNVVEKDLEPSPNVAEESKKTEESVVLEKTTKSPNLSKKDEKSDVKQAKAEEINEAPYKAVSEKKKEKPVVPIILRAASYGPSQKQLAKEKELAKQKADESLRKRGLDKKTVNNPKQGLEEVLVDSFMTDNKSFSSSRKSKHNTDDFEGGDGSNKRGSKKTVFTGQRKLTRHVLTRVMDDEEEERSRSIASYKRAQKKRLMAGANKPQAVKVIRDVTISEAITVGELANRMAVGSGEVIKALMKLGVLASINQVIDGDTAELLCVEFGHRPKRVSEADIEIGIERPEDKPEDLEPRPPVITVMGHVDHGKTSLLDALRKTDIVSTEFGGITQHIGAYQIMMPDSGAKITFLDTPGHAAFSAMRARGANVTDIVVIVVAADDGVNEQTLEAISHAKAANAPMIVAINKIDKNTADPQRVRNELLNHEVVLEEFGGDVIAVEVSAKKGINLDKLVEAILLQADMMELKSNPKGFAEGVVIEASVDKGRGVVATVLVQRGTLKLGDVFVAGSEFGRVKRMVDFRGNNILEAGPSYPVEILGFNDIPMAGDKLSVVETEQRAKEVAEYRYQIRREKEALARNQNSIASMMNKIATGEMKELAIILKADAQGSLEALSASIAKLHVNGVKTQIIHSAIGNINETDIMLAKASNAVVFGFNVKTIPQAKLLANSENIVVDHYTIIYEMLAKIESMMKGLLAPKYEEKKLGQAEVRVVFSKGKVTKIAGCYVTDGVIKRSNAKVHIYRNNEIIFTGKIDTMKHQQDDIKEAKENHDCGIIFEGYNDIKEGDIVESFEMVEIAQK